jgi:hypothetical protein
VSLSGALANSALAFVLPASFYIKIIKPAPGVSRARFLAFPVVVMVVGTLASIIGLVSAIREIIQSHDEE